MSLREQIIGWLKEHPQEDITTTQVAEDLGWNRPQVQQALHGLIRYGMGGQLRRTGQSTWIYQPPTARRLVVRDDVATDIPVGFEGSYRVTAKFEGNHGVTYLLAIIRDGEDTGLCLMATAVFGMEWLAPPGLVYQKIGGDGSHIRPNR